MTINTSKQLIMITRPAHQAGALSQSIQSNGAETFLFPTIDILPAELSDQDKNTLQQLNQFDMIIFISSNAVEHGLNHIQANTKLSDKISLACIGQSSAEALFAKLGSPADIVPLKNFNSEGLLATAEMQNVKNKRLLIIRGNGGREHLKTVLEQRGAMVDYLTAYQRIKPKTKTAELEQYLQNNEIAVIVITSVESLQNLVKMTPKSVSTLLFATPLLLINKRLLDAAKKAGFNAKLSVASQASDSAILATLKNNNLLNPIHD